MSAYFESGFTVREPAWHGMGLVLDDYPTDWEDARVKAGLTWEPSIEPIYRKIGDEYVETPGHVVICRDDTQAALATATDSYELIPNRVMGEVVERMLDRTNVKFETAGSLREGRTVWALALLDEPYTIAGDQSETYPFLALINPHDGSGAFKGVFTDIRVVCWNTASAAEAQGEQSGHQFVFSHRKGVLDRIEEQVAETVARWRGETDSTRALMGELAALQVNDRQFKHWLSEFIPEPPADVVSDRVRENIAKTRRMVEFIYNESATTEGVRGTAYGLFQTSTEYLDHLRGYRSQDTYLGRTLLRPEPMKARSLNLIRRVLA